ncbi:MAG: DUF4321 domain-containing protein [Oscillospiraceae bacterium]|nr:DUF4321 domain-containing protein [Oscillospiraceae bacterium]
MKYKLTLLLCIIVAVIGGAFLGELCVGLPYIEILGRPFTFGFDTVNVDLHFLRFSFGLMLDVNLTQILLLMIAIVVAPKIAAQIKTQ